MSLFKRRGTEDKRESYRLSEIFALILAALQVILPYLAILLLAVLLAFGLFILLFR